VIPSSFAEALIRRIDDETATKGLGIATGSYHTIEAYREAVGERKGMLLVRRMIIEELGKTAPEDARFLEE
jgi:hypothetical protein